MESGTTQRTLRVFVAERRPLYLAALVTAVRRCSDMEYVGSTRTSDEAVGDVTRLRPDVTLLGGLLPHRTEEEILATISRIANLTKVVCLSEADSTFALDALAAGAAGCLSKDVEFDDVCAAVRAAGSDQPALPSEIQSRLLEHFQRHTQEQNPHLTRREHDVLVLAAEGLSTPDIARRLSLSVSTVKTHLHHLYGKLEVHGRAAAVAEGLRRGLLR